MGIVVKCVLLYNVDIIEGFDLYIGDMVYVEKGGEIIFKIIGVDMLVCFMIGEKVKFIIYCLECGSKLIRYEGEVVYYCLNEIVCLL